MGEKKKKKGKKALTRNYRLYYTHCFAIFFRIQRRVEELDAASIAGTDRFSLPSVNDGQERVKRTIPGWSWCA